MPTIFQSALMEALDSVGQRPYGKQTVSYGTGRGVVNDKKIRDAIENHWYAIIRYKSEDDTEGLHTKKRLILPVAYGKTKAGNDVVRAFQQQGDTNTFSPHWKFFRVDRILGWQQQKMTNFDTSNLELYNSEGDESMSVVYVQAKPGKKRKNGSGSVERSKKNTDDNVTVSPKPVSKTEMPKINAGPITKGDIKNQAQPSVSQTQQTQQKTVDNIQQNQYSNVNSDNVENMFSNNSQPITKSQISNENPTVQNTEPVDNSQMNADNTYLTKSDIENADTNNVIQQLRNWNQRLGNTSSDSEEEDEENKELEY